MQDPEQHAWSLGRLADMESKLRSFEKGGRWEQLAVLVQEYLGMLLDCHGNLPNNPSLAEESLLRAVSQSWTLGIHPLVESLRKSTNTSKGPTQKRLAKLSLIFGAYIELLQQVDDKGLFKEARLADIVRYRLTLCKLPQLYGEARERHLALLGERLKNARLWTNYFQCAISATRHLEFLLLFIYGYRLARDTSTFTPLLKDLSEMMVMVACSTEDLIELVLAHRVARLLKEGMIEEEQNDTVLIGLLARESQEKKKKSPQTRSLGQIIDQLACIAFLVRPLLPKSTLWFVGLATKMLESPILNTSGILLKLLYLILATISSSPPTETIPLSSKFCLRACDYLAFMSRQVRGESTDECKHELVSLSDGLLSLSEVVGYLDAIDEREALNGCRIQCSQTTVKEFITWNGRVFRLGPALLGSDQDVAMQVSNPTSNQLAISTPPIYSKGSDQASELYRSIEELKQKRLALERVSQQQQQAETICAAKCLFILDTNILIDHVRMLEETVQTRNVHYALPLVVIEELGGLLKSSKSCKAQKALDFIETLKAPKSIPNKGTVRAISIGGILMGSLQVQHELRPCDPMLRTNDDVILRTAQGYASNPGNILSPIVLSKDINMKIKGQALGLRVIDWTEFMASL